MVGTAGTVTMMFTDIEGSTVLARELGDHWYDVLAEHHAALRRAAERNAGVEVKNLGDGFFFAFTGARDAARAAGEMHAALLDGPIRVRIGIHTGEPRLDAGDYSGLDVHRAARIEAAGHGGQTLLSERTRALLPADMPVTALGLHRLRGLATPEKLFQVGTRQFPPLRSLAGTNLPAQVTPLVGRTSELDTVRGMLERHRLVTLTGPGGSGKTRLALQAAAQAVNAFEDGVTWVPLAAVRDVDLVAPTMVHALGADDDMAEHIGDKRMLIVLDNLEQVIDCGPFLGDLLAACANLALLTTSRIALNLYAERQLQVDPLPEVDAIALFRERAVASEPEQTVAEICRRLDGLPLAIELAAARTRVLTPVQLLERLDRRLPLLTGGSRDLPERQRALRATIEWSYELLSAEEQTAFARLAVFAGGFDAGSADAVADAGLAVLERLVEASVVQWRTGRFSMLETIREYALERLDASGEATALGGQHARHYLELAEQAADEIEGQASVEWLRRLRDEDGNLRAALEWTLQTGETDLTLRLCLALTRPWQADCRFEEGIRWIERGLATPAGAHPGIRARALSECGRLLLFANRHADACARHEQSVALARTLGDPGQLANSLRSLGTVIARNDPQAARPVLAEALELSVLAGDQTCERRCLHTLGEALRDMGEYDEAVELLERSIAVARKIGQNFAYTTHGLADLELDRGNLDRAAALYQEYLRDAVDRDLEGDKVYGIAGIAAVAALRGDDAFAADLWLAVQDAEQRHEFRMLDRRRYEAILEHLAKPEQVALGLDEAVALALR